jgi:hypothetical protein
MSPFREDAPALAPKDEGRSRASRGEWRYDLQLVLIRLCNRAEVGLPHLWSGELIATLACYPQGRLPGFFPLNVKVFSSILCLLVKTVPLCSITCLNR